MREKAARGAIGLCSLFLILALASLWVAFRLTTYPIRRLSPIGAARRTALVSLLQAMMMLAAAARLSTPSSPTSPSPPTAAGDSTEATE